MRAILHIGMNKTGFSAIQGYLHFNEETLLRHGLIYPRGARLTEPSHAALATTIRQTPKALGDIVNWWEEETAKAGADGFIISTEALHTVDPRILGSYLSTRFDVTVVAYVRDHLSYLSSWYRQSIKATNLHMSFPTFASTFGHPFHPWLNNWGIVYGPQNLHVRHYDRALFPGPSQSVVSDFLEVIGVTPATEPSTEENGSISGNLLTFKRLLNEKLSYQEAKDEDLFYDTLAIAQIDPSFHGGMRISPETAGYVYEKFSKDIQNMKSAYGIDLSHSFDPEYGYPSPDAHRIHSDWELVRNFAESEDMRIFPLLDAHVQPRIM